jgi:hypothetical protein
VFVYRGNRVIPPYLSLSGLPVVQVKELTTFIAKVPPDKVDPRQTVALSLETVGILVGGD